VVGATVIRPILLQAMTTWNQVCLMFLQQVHIKRVSHALCKFVAAATKVQTLVILYQNAVSLDAANPLNL
jgi:hypothetical protein